jgi:hypothetical protein
MRWLLIVALLGCSKKTEAPPAPAGPDPDIEAFINDMKTYGDKTLPMMANFSGDCGALADQMLTLEPLAQQIRGRSAALESKQIAMKQRMGEVKGPMMQHYDEVLKPLGLTLADVEKKEAEIKAKCASDAKYHDAEERVGLMKKKSK